MVSIKGVQWPLLCLSYSNYYANVVAERFDDVGTLMLYKQEGMSGCQ